MGALARHSRPPRRDCLRPRDPAPGRAISRGPAIDRVDHPVDFGRLPGCRDPGRRHVDGDHRSSALA